MTLPAATVPATPGVKMMFLIKRKPTTSRDELIAHWFANHMPAVVQGQHALAEQGKPHAHRYLVTLFKPDPIGASSWDGVAQLWFDAAMPRPAVAFGTNPTDSFQERAQPYLPWATREHIVLDGAGRLPCTPLTLNVPFPTSRSGFYKTTFLIKTRRDINLDDFYAHWLGVHLPHVRAVMEQVGGIRYVVSASLAPDEAPYAGMAEMYFPDESAWLRFQQVLTPDGLEQWLDFEGMGTFTSDTELIGIP
jgi:hypothetical protein